MQIKEFAEICGVSVRTLHYYDEIGILKPSNVDEHTGYRFYNEKSLLRMQEILFYRELDFPLKSISEILSSPDYNKEQALSDQKKLLILKKERLERLIDAIDEAEKGENVMSSFNNKDFEMYKNEVKEKWGSTDAYKEYSDKTKGYSKEKFDLVGEEMNLVMAEFAVCMKNGDAISDVSVQLLVKKLQDYITENLYVCTKEILSGLGKMYVLDERFKSNIDKNGDGTARFISEAIDFYCK